MTDASSSVASFCSTIRRTPPASSRITRPYPVASSTTALSTVAAAPLSRWVRMSRGERVVVQERHVAAEHEDVAREVGDLRERDLDGASRAGNLVLVDDDDLGGDAEHGLGDEVAFVPDDHQDALRVQRPRRVEHMTEQRASADAVQHLGSADFIRVPWPAARMTTASWGSVMFSDMLRRQDSNLDLTAPKAVVLPLHHGGPRPPPAQGAAA